MGKLGVALGVIAMMILAGSLMWEADATTATWRSGTLNLPGAAKNYSPIDEIACRGWGRRCPPGFRWSCGPFRCWCRPC